MDIFLFALRKLFPDLGTFRVSYIGDAGERAFWRLKVLDRPLHPYVDFISKNDGGWTFIATW